MRVYSYTVEGAGKFPIDMLRYDMAWPSGSTSVRAIEESHIGWTSKSFVIVLNGIEKPTEGRWNSFGWTVKGVTEVDW